MTFVEFYHNSTGWNGSDFSGPVKLIPKCGSDSVIRLDGRRSLVNQIEDAYDRARSRKSVKGFRIMRGRSYLFNHPLTEIIKLENHDETV